MKCVAVPQLPRNVELSMSKWLGLKRQNWPVCGQASVFVTRTGRTFGYVHDGHTLLKTDSTPPLLFVQPVGVQCKHFCDTFPTTCANYFDLFLMPQMWLHMIPRTIFWLGKMFCSCRCRYDAYEFVCLIQMVFLQRFLPLFFLFVVCLSWYFLIHLHVHGLKMLTWPMQLHCHHRVVPVCFGLIANTQLPAEGKNDGGIDCYIL